MKVKSCFVCNTEVTEADISRSVCPLCGMELNHSTIKEVIKHDVTQPVNWSRKVVLGTTDKSSINKSKVKARTHNLVGQAFRRGVGKVNAQEAELQRRGSFNPLQQPFMQRSLSALSDSDSDIGDSVVGSNVRWTFDVPACRAHFHGRRL